jgi:hypothetical protein
MAKYSFPLEKAEEIDASKLVRDETGHPIGIVPFDSLASPVPIFENRFLSN